MRFARCPMRPINTATRSQGACDGDSIRAARSADEASAAYVRELDNLLLPHVATRLRQRVVEQRGDPDRQLDALKAYFMLNDPQASRSWSSSASAWMPSGVTRNAGRRAAGARRLRRTSETDWPTRRSFRRLPLDMIRRSSTQARARDSTGLAGAHDLRRDSTSVRRGREPAVRCRSMSRAVHRSHPAKERHQPDAGACPVCTRRACSTT